jgi:hypothetical protein
MGEEASTSGRQKALREATIPLNPAITRSRAQQPPRWQNSAAGPGVPESGQSKSLAGSRTRTALQTVTLTRR